MIYFKQIFSGNLMFVMILKLFLPVRISSVDGTQGDPEHTQHFWAGWIGWLDSQCWAKKPLVMSLITTWKRKQRFKKNLKNWLVVLRMTLCAINTSDPYRQE